MKTFLFFLFMIFLNLGVSRSSSRSQYSRRWKIMPLRYFCNI